jgi:glycosyltransferase involved in cell wall biosynthesis
MFLYGSGKFDPRVNRSAMSLAEAGYRVTVIGLRWPDQPNKEDTNWGRIIRVGRRDTRRVVDDLNPLRRGARGLFRLRQALWLARYAQTYRAWCRSAVEAGITASAGASSVVWHGHDLTGLVPAAAAQARAGGSMVYDSHELYLESGSLPRLPGLARRMLSVYEGRLVRRADAVITVNDSIAGELSKRYGVPLPAVVMNCPPLTLKPATRATSPLRSAMPLGSARVLVIHGTLSRGKGLLEAATALALLPDDCKLLVLGRGPLADRLHELSQSVELRGRLIIHPPVSQGELLAWLSGADVAVIAFTPDSLNQRYATPNRLFESLGAGVPVVVSDFPELRRIVEENDLGVVCDPTDPTSIADAARRLLDEPSSAREGRRIRCRKAVEATYNWEHQAKGLVGIYTRLRLRDGA